MPGSAPSSPGSGICAGPFRAMGKISAFYVPFQKQRRYRITGVTKSLSGAAIASVTVNVFETSSGRLRASTVSDVNGNYSVDITGGQGQTYFAVAYKPGSPDVFGTTANTLAGT